MLAVADPAAGIFADPVAMATIALAAVTLLLVVATLIGIWRAEVNAKRQLGAIADQSGHIASQTAALVDEAAASKAMEAEMVEARRSKHPLELEVELTEDAAAGVFVCRVFRVGHASVILTRAEILLGRDRRPGAEPISFANFYLGGSSDDAYVNGRVDVAGSDLLTLRLTGIPENGLEQSVDYQFRILPGGQFERLSKPEYPCVPASIGTDWQSA